MALYIGKNRNKGSNVADRTKIPVKFHRTVQAFGLSGELTPHQWLSRALYLSAPITHPEGNRRFQDVIMDVQDNRLVSLTVFEPDCESCSDTGVFVAIDEDGTRNEWPCPDCNFDKRGQTRESKMNRQGGNNVTKQRGKRARRYA